MSLYYYLYCFLSEESTLSSDPNQNSRFYFLDDIHKRSVIRHLCSNVILLLTGAFAS